MEKEVQFELIPQKYPCSVPGCTERNAHYSPVAIVFDPRGSELYAPLEFDIEVKVCEMHRQTLPNKSYLTDGVWDCIEEAFYLKRKVHPCYGACTIVHETPLGLRVGRDDNGSKIEKAR